ncbi:alpha/beta hydrolase family protein [Sphingosinicella terrae]|uniref:alpha/beta hydrolase family protein n=1 Tax=Sphingosinicella terrae TaxID=2172047 RepID=UPI000E0D8F5F|nr:alpha/beta hydrolase [Sphingosinicella terrae]
MNRILLCAVLAWALLVGSGSAARAAQTDSAAAMDTQRFEFVSGGKRLVGFIDLPAGRPARAMVVIVHGYGATDVAGRTSYHDLRSLFTRLGIATVVWDKPGCGDSEGEFDINQPVESSAEEVIDAARQLRDSRLPGAERIGLWGISRAGWIAPLAITRDPGIAFWISVSGTDALENFPYLLESNLPIEGRSAGETERLVDEWRRGFEITSRGGTFEDYMAATENLRNDPFMALFGGGAAVDESAFTIEQRRFSSGAFTVDPGTGLMVYVPAFAERLSRVNVPVLALFGEKDRNVNWRSTAALYARTIGRNPRARLTIRTFPDGNHNLHRAETGGLREMLTMAGHQPAEGYHEAMTDWLRETVLN